MPPAKPGRVQTISPFRAYKCLTLVYIIQIKGVHKMDKKTLATAIASAIAFILLCVNTFAGTSIDIGDDVINSVAVLLATLIMWVISNYYNQDYSKIARKMTPIMRKIKQLEKAGDLELLDRIQHVIDEWEGEDNDD